ncbi:MAG: sigma-54-dependent transcriptional regulator [Gammaproteobacteria bacterium]
MNQVDVLIVEDDASLRDALSDTLELAGFTVRTAADGLDALEKLATLKVGVVVSDVQMDNMDGLTLMENLAVQSKGLPVILMTAYGTIQKAVKAMQAGAVDYLVKPFDANTLIDRVTKHLSSPVLPDPALIVRDAKTSALYELASKVAKADSTVLLQGESGTGKEVLARFIHENSWRQSGPFIAINCAAIPDNMLEAILFGHERGAFTGAYQAKPGKFELAQGGTLLLDEISEMEIGLQAKLLRVLQERQVERLGGRKAVHLDVRVLATTNRNLVQQVANGAFREDLYYRLNVFPLTIPPLRERRGDILPLANALLERHAPIGTSLPDFDSDAQASLLGYSWPGNVRELENVIQRALILRSGNAISADDLGLNISCGFVSRPESPEAPREFGGLENDLKSTEERLILDALKEEKGSRKLTADRLGISPRTLRYKIARMRKAGITLPG